MDKPPERLDADIRAHGFIGIAVLLITLGTFTYHAWKANGANAQQGISDAVMLSLGQANMDLQSLVDGKEWDQNLTLLRRRCTFGSDFVPAWMVFLFFLQRLITMSGVSSRQSLLTSALALILALATNLWLGTDLDEAARQGAVSAPILNRIIFFGQLKWGCLFLDSFVVGLNLRLRPLIVRVGGVILVCSGIAGFLSIAASFALVLPYCVLGILLAISGISLLILENPEVLYVPASIAPAGSESVNS